MWEERKSPEFDTIGFVPPLEKDGFVGFLKMVTAFVSKSTWQPLLHSLPMPKRGCLKVGMMLPFLVGRLVRRWEAWADDWWQLPSALPAWVLERRG